MNNQEVSFIINGEAGTGKTVLAMYLLKLLSDNKLLDFITDFDEEQMNLYVELKRRFSFRPRRSSDILTSNLKICCRENY